MLRRLHSGPGAWWTWACLSVFGTGGLTVVSGESWLIPLGYGLGTLYPALQLAGSRRYAAASAPVWLVLTAFVYGAARGLAQLAGWPELAHGSALALEPGLGVAAAAIAARADLHGPPNRAQRLLPVGMVAMAGIDAVTAVAMFGGAPIPGWLELAWVLGAPGLLAVQLAAWSALARREFSRAEQLIEARVVETHNEAQRERERERLERELREMQRLESLGRIAGGIAHDLNNVLTVILGNSRLALDDPGTPDELRTRLTRIRAAADCAAALTGQILAYSGKAAPAFEAVDVSRLARGMLDLLRAAVSEPTRIAAVLPDDLPAVEADPTQLRQLLLNLVANASEALGEAGGEVRIRTGTRSAGEGELPLDPGAGRRAGACVFLEVSDSGRGLDVELRDRIFEPFVSSKAAGRGLGLATVRGIVERHRGAIRVDTAPGRGTTFCILLPCSARRPADAAEAPALRPLAPPGGTVLLVDDDAAVCEVAREFLTRGGFRVLTAASGGEAVARVREAGASIDAVVLDLVLPDLSGEQTFLRLRDLRPGLPVVLASGYDPEQAAERFSARGLAGFVRKPYAAEDLLRGVHGALERRSAR
jgi:signal transduction histidine kinase/CheY-like chemotaxis protein